MTDLPAIFGLTWIGPLTKTVFNQKHENQYLSTAGEGNVFRGVCLSTEGVRETPPGQRPPDRDPLSPLDRDPSTPVLTSSGGYCSGRYASYWTAFLLVVHFEHCTVKPTSKKNRGDINSHCLPTALWTVSFVE